MDFNYILNATRGLNKTEQLELIKCIEEIVNEDTSNNLFVKAVEYRYNSGIICPHCGHKHVKRNGHDRVGKQRYYCLECNRSFLETTNTFLEGTKLSLKTWMNYIKCFCNNLNLRESARQSGISLKTSFFMRHKIIDCLYQNHNIQQLEGIVEIDEASVNTSYSGNHKRQDNTIEMPRKSYKRSRKGKTLHCDNKSDERNIIASAIDRNNHIFLKVAKNGTTTLDTESIKKIYGNIIAENSILCSDGQFGYRALAKENHLELHSFTSKSKEKRGLYHINNINNLHSQMKRYFRTHLGISTKYLDNYLTYISWQAIHKNKSIIEKSKDLFLNIFKISTHLRQKDLIRTGF